MSNILQFWKEEVDNKGKKKDILQFSSEKRKHMKLVSGIERRFPGYRNIIPHVKHQGHACECWSLFGKEEEPETNW